VRGVKTREENARKERESAKKYHPHNGQRELKVRRGRG
jgi:hypothetical protein